MAANENQVPNLNVPPPGLAPPHGGPPAGAPPQGGIAGPPGGPAPQPGANLPAGPPAGQANPAQPAPRVSTDENNFSRLAPKFEIGNEPWDLFYERYKCLADRYQISTYHFKSVMFSSLGEQAFALACPNYAPTGAPYDAMTGSQYADALQELFEPAAETDAMRLEFLNRVQLPDERPDRYYRDKTRMFIRAYKRNLQDWNYFYQEVISGLINEEVKYRMRGFRPVNPADPNEFQSELIHWSTVQRTRYRAGEVSQSEVLGAETMVTGISYRNFGNGGVKVKEEVSAISGEVNAFPNRNKRFMVKKANSKDDGNCWHCGVKGHFANNCPRKLTGLAPAAATVADQKGTGVYRKGASSRKTTKKPVTQSGARNSVKQPRGRFRKFNKRIAHLYEDEDGNTYIGEGSGSESDSNQDENEAPPEEETSETDEAIESVQQGINALDLHSRYGQELEATEADFIPGAFLGM